MESEDGDIFDVADPRSDFENTVISEMQIATFAESTITEKDREILKLLIMAILISSKWVI